MTYLTIGRRGRLIAGAALAVASGSLGLPGAAFAQAIATQAGVGAPPSNPPPDEAASDDLAVSLTQLLVQQKVISQEVADTLIAEARRKVAARRAAAASTAPLAVASVPAASVMGPGDAGVTRIPYVPQIVMNQIRDDVRAQVMKEAREQNWAQPNQIPKWTQKIKISGDLRFRDEFDEYAKHRDVIDPTTGKPNGFTGNANDVINFAALNANGPVDVNPATNATGVPLLNTTKDRSDQLSIRARLDIQADPTDYVTADVRLASGQTNSPVSTTQALGGGLTKKDIWLDRAYIDVHPVDWAGATFGRMPNPFFTTDLVFDTDLNFDGAAARARWDILPHRGISVAANAGAFLIGYSDANFPTYGVDKSGTRLKWMFAAQGLAEWKTDRFDWKAGGAYFQYQYDRGLLSEPCALYTGLTQCSTDFTVPAFMQKGNTLFLIRDIVPNPAALPGATPLPQYAGLLFDYNILNLNTTFTLKFGQRNLALTADYARNLAYKYSDSCRYGESGLPVNNVQSAVSSGLVVTDPCSPNSPAHFKSGPNAWMLRATYGDADTYAFGKWNITAGYKRIAPDALPDAFTDSDFHLGGTNAEGYFLIGSFGILDGLNLETRWFSANELYNSPLSIDVGQIDLNARF